MEKLFSTLKYPFVYLDCSYIFRSNISEAQSLTRRLLRQYPSKFNAEIEKIRARAECEALYYQQIHALQQAGIISSLITFEIFHECIIPASSKVIPLFGQYSAQPHDGSSIILWGENVHSEKYIKASTTLLDAKCIVADVAFFDLVVGKELEKYIINEGTLFLIGNSPEKKGGIHMAYRVPPQSFINALYSNL